MRQEKLCDLRGGISVDIDEEEGTMKFTPCLDCEHRNMCPRLITFMEELLDGYHKGKEEKKH